MSQIFLSVCLREILDKEIEIWENGFLKEGFKNATK
jgi:hypothetical protein